MRRLARSFRFAFVGLAHLLRTQRNFRIELVVDLASPALHPKAKAAKDIAAGMVLVAAAASIAVAVALFGPRLVR